MTASIESLDRSDDEADWIAPGHVLDQHEVDFLRRCIHPDRISTPRTEVNQNAGIAEPAGKGEEGVRR